MVNEWAQSPGARLAGTISFPGALSHKVLHSPLPGPLSSVTRSPQRQSRCLGDGPRCAGWVFCLDRCLPTGKCWTSFGARSGAKLMHQGLGTPGVFQPSYSPGVSLGSWNGRPPSLSIPGALLQEPPALKGQPLPWRKTGLFWAKVVSWIRCSWFQTPLPPPRPATNYFWKNQTK